MTNHLLHPSAYIRQFFQHFLYQIPNLLGSNKRESYVENNNILNLKTVIFFIALIFNIMSVKSQTWLCSSAISSGSPSGYVHGGITYYKGTSGGTTTVNSGLADCHGSTSNIQMGSSLFIILSTTNISGIVIYGNSGTGSSRTFSSITTSSTLAGTYTSVGTASATGSITGSQATNVCSPNSLAINFGTTINAGVYIKVTLSGNAYVAAIDKVSSCTAPISKTVTGEATICSGSSTNVTLASSQSGVTYQLYAGASPSGSAVSGTGTDLTWSVSPTSTTTYTVKTTTAGGYCETTMNGSAEITVNPTTAISSQSTAAATYGQNFGSPTALTVTAAGAGLNYQWYKSTDAATNTAGDDTEVGTNSNSYAPSPSTMGTSYYYCVVTGSCGTATSAISGAIEIIEACTAPTFSTQPTDNQTECVGGSLTLGTVAADQSATYQWYSVDTKTNTGGTTVGSSNGGSTATFTPSSATAGTYYYYCVATSGACYTSSNAVQITVYPTNPIVSQSTAAANYSLNATATALSITTPGTGLSYQWYSNTTASNTGGSIINDATSSSFTPPTTSLGTTYYYCVVSGGCSSPNTSNVSGAIVISPYAVGDYGSVASGTWAISSTWKKWDGSGWNTVASVAPTASDNVWIVGGYTVTVGAAGVCKDLHIINGTLYKNAVCNSANTSAGMITVSGTIVEVESNGTVGNGLIGDTGDAVSLTINGTTCTILGDGGSMILSKLILAANTNLTIDRDLTVIYHGNTFGGNADGLYSSGTPTTLTINSGKTVTLAPYSCFYLGSSSTALAVCDMTLNIYGTMNMMSGKPDGTPDNSLLKAYFSLNVGTAKTATVHIYNGGILTVNDFYPNGTSSSGTATGTSTITVDTGGTLNCKLLADFSRNASQTITGLGTVNILAGCEVKVANTTGVNGHIQTNSVNINEDAKFSFFGSEAQVSGSMFANANTVTVNNTAGLTISENSNIENLTIASGAKLNIAAGKQLTLGTEFTNNGTIHLKSDASGTATVLLPSNVSGTGAAIAEQYLATTRNWYISSPVSNAVAPAGYTYYQRDEAGSSWTSRPFVADSTFVRGRGYIALPGSEAAVITFSTEMGGSLNTGDIPVYLTFAGTSSKGYNLIGNPYPSHLTWTKTFVDNNASLIEPSIYYRTTTGTANNQTGWSFKTINASTGEVSPSGTSNTIPPMQAFWIRAKASGVLTLNSSLTKSHNASNPLKAPATKNADRQRLRLQVDNGTATDEAVIYFDAAASDAYDRYDSPKFNEANTVTQIYTTAGTEKLVINGMSTIPLNQEIGLGFVPGSASAFSLRATELTNIPSDVRVILKDNVSKAETDLTDGVSVYEFAPATTTDNRFSVIFRTAGVTTGFEKSIVPKAYVYVNANNQITINAPEKSNYSIYNAMGQLIENGILTSNTQTSNFKPAVGMYVVKVDNQSIRVIIK